MTSTFPWHQSVIAFCQWTILSGSYDALRRSVCSNLLEFCPTPVGVSISCADGTKRDTDTGHGDARSTGSRSACWRWRPRARAACASTGCRAAAVPDARRRASHRRAPRTGACRARSGEPGARDARRAPRADGTAPPRWTATRWSAPRSRCAARRTATAAPIRSGFDCSGFTQYVFAQYGVVAAARGPRAVSGGEIGRRRTISRRATSLFFTTTAPGPSHVGDRDRRRSVRPRAELDRRRARRAPELDLLVAALSSAPAAWRPNR